jgi:hypothetical protein
MAGPRSNTEHGATPSPFSRGAGDHDFDAWLGRLNQRTDPAMPWLGVLFALLVGFN